MAGVVIGSLITKYQMPSPSVRAIAVTVNNECNLSCPHCYLQYEGPKTFMAEATRTALLASPYQHIAIVGKEPLFNRVHASQTLDIAQAAKSQGKDVSLITNGLGLHFLTHDELAIFDYIDVSVDGGPESYRKFRGGSHEKLMKGLAAAATATHFHALNTICQSTSSTISDTITGCPAEIFSKVYFSPYVDAKSHGASGTQGLPLLQILTLLRHNEAFMNDPRAFLLVDFYHIAYEGLTRDQVAGWVERMSLQTKVHLIPHTPLTLGIVRVTYEGQILPPETAIHTARYGEWSYRVGEKSLNSAFAAFCADETKLHAQHDHAMVA